MFSDVSDVLRMLKIAHRCSTDILRWVQDVFRCFQMFKGVFRCSQMFLDVLLMFSRCSQDDLRICPWCFHDVLLISDPIVFEILSLMIQEKWWSQSLWWSRSYFKWIQRNFMIPRYLMIQREFQLEVWTLIIQKSTVIPSSSMVLFTLLPPLTLFIHTICTIQTALYCLKSSVFTYNVRWG